MAARRKYPRRERDPACAGAASCPAGGPRHNCRSSRLAASAHLAMRSDRLASVSCTKAKVLFGKVSVLPKIAPVLTPQMERLL